MMEFVQVGQTRYRVMTREEWRATHRDYKGRRVDGTRVALTLDPETGATCLVPVVLREEVAQCPASARTCAV